MEISTTATVVAAAPKPEEVKPKKRNSVRHTRAIQRDRTRRPLGAPPAAAVVARLTEIVHPATLAQVSHFHGLGLRGRLLILPVMVGLVLGLLWRQPGGINELVRVIHVEAVLWAPPLRKLTQQALAQRLRSLPGVADDPADLAESLAGAAARWSSSIWDLPILRGGQR